MAEAAATFDTLLDMCDKLSKWQVDPASTGQAGVVAESHRLAFFMDQVSAATSKVMYPHDPLRVRMAKSGLPWDAALLTDLRWAAQRAAAALMQMTVDTAERVIK